MGKILGIDPGSRTTGFGVIETDGNQHKFITCGCINTDSNNIAGRLKQIHDGITEVIKEYPDVEVSIEQVFMHRNPNSALKLGHARGAAIVAAANFICHIAEYSPRVIKQAVVGHGGADKVQVQHMVKTLLNLSTQPTEDAADALAIAICHAQMRNQRTGVRFLRINMNKRKQKNDRKVDWPVD